MNRPNTFDPDLIIEVTAVCDRACAGCYAPNLVSKRNPQELYRERPELFISIKSLKAFFSKNEYYNCISIRGGEPSLHPELRSILVIASEHARQVVLETHGRWILSESEEDLVLIKNSAATIKVSFDRMHKLSLASLKSITSRLHAFGIPYLIGITEKSHGEFLAIQSACNWIPQDRMLYQPMGTTVEGLIKPQQGVLGVDGQLRGTLSTKPKFIQSAGAKNLETQF